MKTTILLAAAAAISLATVGAADAAVKKKHHAPVAAQQASGPFAAFSYPKAWETPRPPWAQPQECFTDEGYGRYTSCSTGKE